MSVPPAPTLEAWHDFYAAIGTFSATLLGAMFVVASIGSGFLTHERAEASRIFLTPVVVHLTTILLGCALTMAPGLDWRWLGVLLGGGSLAGCGYAGFVGLHVRRRPVDRDDRIWYGGLPVLAHAALLAAAVLALLGHPYCLDVLAAGLALLLVASIRNAWDLILFFVRESAPSRTDPPGPSEETAEDPSDLG